MKSAAEEIRKLKEDIETLEKEKEDIIQDSSIRIKAIQSEMLLNEQGRQQSKVLK